MSDESRGEAIKRRLDELGMTYRRFEVGSGVSRKTLQRAIRGDASVRPNTYQTIEHFLDGSPAEDRPLTISFIDDTTDRLVDFLCERLDAEPEAPDMDVHHGHLLEEVARVHEDWSRQVSALRLLIGVRLTEAAIAARR